MHPLPPVLTDRKGTTLLELMLVALLVSLCLGLVFLLTRQGLSVVSKVGRQADVMQQLQVLGSLFSRDAMATSAASVDLSSHEMAFLAPRTSESEPVLEGLQCSLVWPAYRFYYWDGTTQEIWVRDLDRPNPDSRTPRLEEVDLGWGLQSLQYYRGAGKRLAQGVIQCTFFRGGRRLRLSLKARRRGYAAEDTLELSFTSTPRNP